MKNQQFTLDCHEAVIEALRSTEKTIYRIHKDIVAEGHKMSQATLYRLVNHGMQSGTHGMSVDQADVILRACGRQMTIGDR